MNHGPSKAVLVIALCAFLAGGVIYALPGTALAQDRAQIDELFDQAQQLWKTGNVAEAADKLKELLAADPGQSKAYDLLRKAETQMFLDLLKAGGDPALTARRLLELAHPGELQRIKDEGAIRELVAQAIGGEDHGKRTQAIRLLLANHGEYSVPFLFPYLGSNDKNERIYAILALSELGPEAVLPLVEVLHSSEPLIQQNAAIVLERVGDVRALGGLISLAAHAQDEGVQAAAASAVASMLAKGHMHDSAEAECDCGSEECAVCGAGGGAMAPAQAYLKLSKWYYSRDSKVMKNYLGAYTLWEWAGNALVSREVPSYLYHLELAEEALYDALAEEPGNEVARYALTGIHYAEMGAISSLGADAMADESVQALAKMYGNVLNISAAQGVDAALGALHLGLEMNDSAIALGALHVLPFIWDGRAIAEGSPLAAALGADQDKIVRFAAAVTLLYMQPAEPFPGSEEVVGLAAMAAATGSARQVLLIEPSADVRARALVALAEGKLFPIAEASGARGFRRALEVGTFDVIVIRFGLSDMLAVALVNQLRADFRTGGTPILISGTAEELDEAKALFGTKVQGFIDVEIAADTVRDAAAGSMNDDQKRALHVSKSACDGLAMINPSSTVFGNFADAEGALIGVVESDKPDDIRLAALAALGRIGSAASSEALVGAFTGTANATSVRVAAAMALGKVFKGQAAPAAVYDALLGGFGDEAAEVRMASGMALGAMDLSAEQRNGVLTGYRVK